MTDDEKRAHRNEVLLEVRARFGVGRVISPDFVYETLESMIVPDPPPLLPCRVCGRDPCIVWYPNQGPYYRCSHGGELRTHVCADEPSARLAWNTRPEKP